MTVYVMAAPATVGVPLMVTTLPAHVPVTPVGRLLTVAPVAPVVAYVIGAIGVLMHTVCASVPAPEVLDIVLLAFTVIVPVAVMVPHPPVRVTVYVLAAPATVGVPLMVTTLPDHVPVTPVGRLLTVAPVAPVVAYVIGAIGVLMHTVCAFVPAAEVSDTVLFAVTAMVPVAVTTLQPPVRVTVYVMAAPATVGVPLMVTTLPDHVPVTPVGRLLTVAPVAPVVAYVIGAIGVLMHTVCAFVPAAEVSVTVLLGFTAMVPVAVMVPHPPVRVTVYVLAAPATVGVPLMVTTLPAHVPVTPVGRLLTVAPVAPVVAYVIGAIGVLMHTVLRVRPGR